MKKIFGAKIRSQKISRSLINTTIDRQISRSLINTTIDRSFSSLVTSSTSTTNRVLIISLNDPLRLNALTEKMGDELNHHFSQIDLKKTGAVVLTGNGKAFSTGGDLDFLKARSIDTPSNNMKIMVQFYKRFLIPLRTCPVPVIAAVHGSAIGAGACLATATDYRIVAKDAKIGFTFANLGIHAGMGATHFLANRVGSSWATRLLLTGEVVTGSDLESMKWGFSQDTENVLPFAILLAEKISAAAPEAVRGMVQTIRRKEDVGLDIALDREAAEQASCYAGIDFKTGLQAILTKTRPVFEQY
jgi:enoyl-CoA hydratase